MILAAVLVQSLAACAPSSNGGETTTAADNDAAGQLLVGYGRADITPMDSVPLQGYGITEQRMSQGFLSKMYAIALAITDAQGETAIVIACDACWFNADTTTEIANKISEQCGVDADKVITAALHQHSAPDMYNNKAPSGITYRKEVFIPGAVAAAKAAMENRAAATVQSTKIETENMNFVRHYKMEDGTYAGDNFGNWKLKPVGHSNDGDNDLQLVKFVRQGQKTQDGKDAKDIILTNFQGHPHMGSGATSYSAHSDLVGVYRDTLEEKLDCQVIYFSGAGGDMNMTSRIEEENLTDKDYKRHGKKLADLVIDAQDTFADMEFSAVKGTKVSFYADYNGINDADLVQKATEAWNYYLETGSEELVKKYGFQSKYEAAAIITADELPEGGNNFDIFALSFGDLAFIAAPYEMFNQSGVAVKEGSPFKMTMIASIANGGEGYLPTAVAWDYGCYEQYSSSYARGTAENLVDAYVGMLKDLHGQY